MQLGLTNRPKHNLIEEITWIGRTGFDYIDLIFEAPNAALENTDWKCIAAAIQKAELDVVCQSAHYLPLNNPSSAVRQAALDDVRRSIDAAKIVDAPILTIPFIGWPAYLPEKVGYEFIAQMFGILVKHATERGIELALENSPRNQHQLKYFREIFHRLPTLKLTYNIGHGNVGTASQHTSRDYLFALSGALAHVRLNDNNGQTDDHLMPGTPEEGGINLDWELSNLQNFRYDGRITLDFGGDRHWAGAFAERLRASAGN